MPVILACSPPFGALMAQEPGGDSSARKQISLEEVLIRGVAPEKPSDLRQTFTAGQETKALDSTLLGLYSSRSLRDLLMEQSPVFVKSFGVNSMATLSFRGASAAQSAVRWNGVPVLNPTLGVTDISVLQTGLFDEVGLQYGSSAALFGSGNVGGALILAQSAPEFADHRHFESALSLGSFGRFNYQLKGRVETNRFRVDWRGFYQIGRNNFPYRKGDTRVEMENAALEGLGGILTLDYNLAPPGDSREHVLRASLWMQKFEREIPPALFEPQSLKRETDYSTRALLSWSMTGRRLSWYAKGALSGLGLAFRPDPGLPSSENKLFQTYMEAGVKASFQTFQNRRNPGLFPLFQETLLFVPLEYDYAPLARPAAGDLQDRFRPAVAVAHKVSSANDRFLVNAALRLERLNADRGIWLPGLGASARLFDRRHRFTHFKLSLRANVQRTCRLPSLNELYFEPGGNPSLKPEQGWSKDAGYELELAKFTGTGGLPIWRLEHSLSGFDRHIRDWIYWLGGAIWTPHNLAAVHSRGIETDSRLSLFFSDIHLKAGLQTAYILATTTASYLPDDGSIGRQIPYTPRYSLSTYLSFGYRELLLAYAHTYTGYRFVTVDESQYIEPFDGGTLQLNYKINREGGYFSLGLNVSNLWDRSIEMVRGRPAPGRHYAVQLTFGF